MKKLSITLAFILSFSFTGIALAANDGAGACSSHKGVNCSIGADRDGSVICNDGWKKSTVAYKIVKMCMKTTKKTPLKNPLLSNQK